MANNSERPTVTPSAATPTTTSTATVTPISLPPPSRPMTLQSYGPPPPTNTGGPPLLSPTAVTPVLPPPLPVYRSPPKDLIEEFYKAYPTVDQAPVAPSTTAGTAPRGRSLDPRPPGTAVAPRVRIRDPRTPVTAVAPRLKIKGPRPPWEDDVTSATDGTGHRDRFMGPRPPYFNPATYEALYQALHQSIVNYKVPDSPVKMEPLNNRAGERWDANDDEALLKSIESPSCPFGPFPDMLGAFAEVTRRMEEEHSMVGRTDKECMYRLSDLYSQTARGGFLDSSRLPGEMSDLKDAMDKKREAVVWCYNKMEGYIQPGN